MGEVIFDGAYMSSKVRVLHISKYYYPFAGGTELVARECVRALQGSVNQSYEQIVFCFDHGGMKGAQSKVSSDTVDLVDGVKIVRCACQMKVASQSLSFSYRRRLKSVFKQFQPDMVVLHYPNPFGTHFLLQFIRPSMKLVVFWHLDIVKQKFLGKLFRGQNIRLLERADALIAASPNYAEGSPWLSRYPQKCVIIPDCIHEEGLQGTADTDRRVQEICDLYQGKILCLAVGRHVEYKGFRYLIESAEYLDKNYVIVITGNGPLTEELKKQARKGSGRVIFAGLISEDDLKAYLKACDIFCFPSITKNEAFGLALAEAMYCGKPAVTYTIKGSGVNYVSLGGETGIECANRDSKAYAEAIRTLGEDPELRARYGRAARRRVEENFLYKQFSEHICELFENLVSTMEHNTYHE